MVQRTGQAVALAAIRDHQGRLLLTQRPSGVDQGGLWEFPGGKQEPGESIEETLRRELYEELAILPATPQPLLRLAYRANGLRRILHLCSVDRYHGKACPQQGQPLRWVTPEQLVQYPMPSANRPLITALRLPPHYLITALDDLLCEPPLVALERALQRGIRLVQVRAPGVAEERLLALAQQARQLCHRYHARLLLNAPPHLVTASAADGIHLPAWRLLALSERPLPAHYWVGASCHTPRELQQALALGVDFALLSPVLATASHPHATPLGWRRFARMVRDLPLPVYALGGMTRDHLTIARQHGGHGIAAIRGLAESTRFPTA